MPSYIPVGPCVHCGADNALPCPLTGHVHERLVVDGDPQGGVSVPRTPTPDLDGPGKLREQSLEPKGKEA